MHELFVHTIRTIAAPAKIFYSVSISIHNTFIRCSLIIPVFIKHYIVQLKQDPHNWFRSLLLLLTIPRNKILKLPFRSLLKYYNCICNKYLKHTNENLNIGTVQLTRARETTKIYKLQQSAL